MSEYIISDKELLSIKNKCYEAGKHGSQAFTCRAPSEEIVRCRDCRNFKESFMRCKKHFTELYANDGKSIGMVELSVKPDDFCSQGEQA